MQNPPCLIGIFLKDMCIKALTLFRMGVFEAANEEGGVR